MGEKEISLVMASGGSGKNRPKSIGELQKELEITAKNCRILQYKLRKAERKGEITEAERAAYEEKIQSLTKQMEETGDKSASHDLKKELDMSKQISLKLHEEIDGLNKTKEAK